MKTLCRGHMFLVILTEKKLLEHFKILELQNENQKDFRIEKAIKEKAINYILNGKKTVILFSFEMIKKTI